MAEMGSTYMRAPTHTGERNGLTTRLAAYHDDIASAKLYGLFHLLQTWRLRVEELAVGCACKTGLLCSGGIDIAL